MATNFIFFQKDSGTNGVILFEYEEMWELVHAVLDSKYVPPHGDQQSFQNSMKAKVLRIRNNLPVSNY